jgi:gliding motility-associated-like protein
MQGYQITVFNRWGQVVYEGMNGWDGKYQGAEVNTGSYYFTLKYNSSNSAEIEYKGTLMLVR